MQNTYAGKSKKAAMMTVYLHIGFHKTGSTSVQALLRHNRALASHKAKVFVQGDAAIRPLEDACRNYDRQPSRKRGAAIGLAWQKLLSEFAQGPDTWIISSEDFLGRIPSNRDTSPIYARTPEILEFLQAASPAVAIKFCVYLREPKGWLDSIHRHLVRTRGLAITAKAFHALQKFSSHPDPLADAAARIDAVLHSPLHRFTLEGDSATYLGPGYSLLQQAGFAAAELEKWSKVDRQNEGLDCSIVSRMSSKVMLRLPRLIRRIIIKRAQLRGQ
jgi:hypothetical protein